MTAQETNSFPKPTILRAAVGAGYVYNDGENDVLYSVACAVDKGCSARVEKINVLYSCSGARYELGRVLKKAIFGVVLHATLLSPVAISLQSDNNNSSHNSGGNSLMTHKAFTRTKVSFAIKIYSKDIISAHIGRSKENPLMELSALQYLGDHYSSVMGQIECCADDAYIYSIMRFCPGGELFDYILQNGKLTETEARKIFRQLITGLQIFQERGIGHLDISLENILYHPCYQQIMIIDFGMCHKLTQKPSLTQHNSPSPNYEPILNNHSGKKNYMAPEIINDNPFVDAIRCDLWSAGICLLYILLGFPPIEIASMSDLRFCYLINGRLLELLEHWDVALSRDVIDLLQKILRIHPEERLTIEEILAHPWMGEDIFESTDPEKREKAGPDAMQISRSHDGAEYYEESKTFRNSAMLHNSSPINTSRCMEFYSHP